VSLLQVGVGDVLLLGVLGVHMEVDDVRTAMALLDTCKGQVGGSLCLHLVEANIVDGDPLRYYMTVMPDTDVEEDMGDMA